MTTVVFCLFFFFSLFECVCLLVCMCTMSTVPEEGRKRPLEVESQAVDDHPNVDAKNQV